MQKWFIVNTGCLLIQKQGKTTHISVKFFFMRFDTHEVHNFWILFSEKNSKFHWLKKITAGAMVTRGAKASLSSLLSDPLPLWSGSHPCYLLEQCISMTVLSKHWAPPPCRWHVISRLPDHLLTPHRWHKIPLAVIRYTVEPRYYVHLGTSPMCTLYR